MCVIIVNPKNVISYEQHFICKKKNPHGFGFMFAKNGKLKIYKAVRQIDNLFEKYQRLRLENPAAVFVLHYRWRTHGKISRANTHPFVINESLAFCHNGVIPGLHDERNVFSDTYIFNEFLKDANPHSLDDLRETTLPAVGFSKFAFLDTNGKVLIHNKKAGAVRNGDWFSNPSVLRL